MRALILAAGVGRRLGDFTADHPKCLLPIGGRTLLRRMLDALAQSGIGETAVVVGHCGDDVRVKGGSQVGAMAVGYLENPDYRKGSILSLHRACEILRSGDTVVLMDADVLFPVALLRRLVGAPEPSCALLDGRVDGTGEEMILCAAEGRIWDIVRRPPGAALVPPPGVKAYDTAGESVGFFKLAGHHAVALAEILDRVVARGESDAEYESVFPELFARCEIGYQRVDDLPWTEVDFPRDAERARSEILPLVEAEDGV